LLKQVVEPEDVLVLLPDLFLTILLKLVKLLYKQRVLSLDLLF